MTDPGRAWTTGKPPNKLAALPTGPLGMLGGWMMSRMNRSEQREVLDLAAVAAGESVLEVGYGPGVLLADLVTDTKAGRIVGIDPSPEMRVAAAKRTAAAIVNHRVRLEPGTAEATGQPPASFDVILSVNTVAIWPDLDAGVRELARVLRPGGRLLLSWHGGTAPTRAARSMILPEERLERVHAALAAGFASVERLRTEHCDVFRAS
ncbi:class I SAM-dependent methyltransferase [Pseudonocardia acaciae]|uniref:class I SAM-dependent methyltransferase n=1 Tax=Pseudonocardia acaciae TaxID=551276 RepID=UPI000688BC1F|nr:methyltransferase domain-containing protein [Pseudonocardia acaciae]